MPRKLDNDTRIHFRTFEDEAHTQRRAFCLHCQKEACADNVQRMRNHLTKCEAYINSNGGEPSFAFAVDRPAAPDTLPTPGMLASPTDAGNPLPTSSRASAAPHPPASGPGNVVVTTGPSVPPVSDVKASQDGLNQVRTAMARSTKRLESLEAVLKTQIQDGLHSAAAHVRAAIRDERDRLFKLSQALVKQETKARELQAAVVVPL